MRKHSIWWPNPFQVLILSQWIPKILTTSLVFSPELQSTTLSSHRCLQLDIAQASQTQQVQTESMILPSFPKLAFSPGFPNPENSPIPHLSQDPQSLCFSSSSATNNSKLSLVHSPVIPQFVPLCPFLPEPTSPYFSLSNASTCMTRLLSVFLPLHQLTSTQYPRQFFCDTWHSSA